ncbi:hypothetical protein EMIT0P12_10456 [Pseudomonas sp. IT-P12]
MNIWYQRRISVHNATRIDEKTFRNELSQIVSANLGLLLYH